MIKRSSEYDILSGTYQKYKSILAVETDDILMTTQNKISFERLTKYIDTLFDYTFQ